MPRAGRAQDKSARENREALLERLRAGDHLGHTPVGWLWNDTATDRCSALTVNAAVAAGAIRIHGRAAVLA